MPVYEGDKGNILGLLFVKSLIMIDPDDATPIKDIYKAGSFLTSSTTELLFDLLDKFQTGRSKCSRWILQSLLQDAIFGEMFSFPAPAFSHIFASQSTALVPSFCQHSSPVPTLPCAILLIARPFKEPWGRVQEEKV